LSERKRIDIQVPDAYKDVPEDIWADLEKVLYAGFLTATAPIQNASFTFKTINQNEIKLLELARGSLHDITAGIKFRNRFIAYSVCNVNGTNFLHKRHDHIERLVRTFEKLPSSVLDLIMVNLAALNEKYARLHPLVEVYVYENRSRFKWMHIKTAPVNVCTNTGIPGTDELGMNSCQQVWTAMNYIIDRREEMERDWAHAKFIGSCFAGKGIRTIDERDKARAEREKQDREDLKKKILYRYVNKKGDDESPEERMTLPDGRQATVVKRFKAENADDLARELSAALSGEKDHHDMVIEAKQREMASRAREIEEHRFDLYKRNSDADGQPQASRVMGGKKEVDAYLERMRLEREKRISVIRSADLSDKSSETSDGD
jgi:hypothetical protein